MTRITDGSLAKSFVAQVLQNRAEVNKYADEVSSGLKVRNPGETRLAGSVSRFREMLTRIEGYNSRIASATSTLSFQDDIMNQANEILTRAKEIATQAANETNGAETRRQMAEEVFQLRDELVNLANLTYQGKYIYGGADDDDPPYDMNGAFYVNPASGNSHVHYQFDAEPGTDQTRNVQITDDVAIRINTPADDIFENAVQSLERLGRALDGYETQPAAGAPDGNGFAFTFPDDYDQQTSAIQNALELIEQARRNDVIPERVSLGARITRLQTADSILSLNKKSAEEVLGQIQDADVVESASKLTLAQTAFEASLQVTLRALNLSIVDFI